MTHSILASTVSPDDPLFEDHTCEVDGPDWSSVGRVHPNGAIYSLLGCESHNMGVSGDGGHSLLSTDVFLRALDRLEGHKPENNCLALFFRECAAVGKPLYVCFW